MSASPYRATAGERPMFSERQLEWIRATSSAVEVTANLAGRSNARPARGAPDEAMQVMFWLGLAFGAFGIYAFLETSSLLALLPGSLGALALFGALTRAVASRRRRTTPPEIEVLTIAPVFEDRTLTGADDVPKTFRFVRARADAALAIPIVWPAKLHPFGESLAERETLRVGLIGRGDLRHVGWAFPTV